MKAIQQSLLFAAVILVCTTTYAQKWTPEMYQKHTYSTFIKLEMVHRPIDPKNVDYGLLNAAIFYITNHQREMHQLPTLEHSPGLEKAAFEHSKDMIEHNFFLTKARYLAKGIFGSAC
ncbi:MAG: hypothetical protein RMJ44_00695 [Cytophagales bacterium]|nr:hypothetical protein [Bernardetiaceae bacterium]MDW8209577.1 hypothetical protein [Cytophagales bacterium]